MKKNNAMFALLIPRLHDVLFVAIFIGALMIGPRMINNDLGRHLASGKYMMTALKIPTRDLFSFTKQNQSRPPYEWLAQLFLYIFYRFLKLDGVIILTAFVLALAFLIVFIDSVHRCKMPILALLLTLWAVSASSLHWLSRPHIFSFLFIAIWIQWLEKIRKDEIFPLWLFPALMLIWANTHGGFIFGILAWLAYLAGWLWESWRKSVNVNIGRKLMIVGATSLITSILTPDLWRNWQGVFNNNSIYILNHTSETIPPNLAIPGILPFTVLLALTLILLLLGWKRFPTSHIFLLIGFSVISLIMARNIPLFAIISAPILSGVLREAFSRIPLWFTLEERVIIIDKVLRGYVWPILILLAMVGVFAHYQAGNHASFNQFDPQTFPVQAVDWIELHPLEGNMFNDLNWGGYLLFRLWPGKNVFIDSQSDFYKEALTRQYAEILNGDGNWDEELRQYEVNWIIVSPQTGLAKAASVSPHWQLAYGDPVAVIYDRK